MQVPKNAKLAMAKILQADAEFQNSVGDHACDAEKQKQLAAAVRTAVDEFIDVAAALWPEFRTPDASNNNALSVE